MRRLLEMLDRVVEALTEASETWHVIFADAAKRAAFERVLDQVNWHQDGNRIVVSRITRAQLNKLLKQAGVADAAEVASDAAYVRQVWRPFKTSGSRGNPINALLGFQRIDKRGRLRGIGESRITADNRFDAAQALYWYAADNHGGQSSALYSILSRLDYRPGERERGPNTEEAEQIYSALERGELTPDEVLKAVQAEED